MMKEFTPMGQLMSRYNERAVLFNSDLSKEEKKIMDLLIEDGIAFTYCKGRGHLRSYELTRKGKQLNSY